jgi:Ca2+-binding RTX toxin-like protein
MTRKLIVIALALGVGLAVTGVAGARWFNVIRGTSGNDVIAGTAQRDYILGLAGNDQISAAEGRDVAFGGRGDDTIDGGPGLDRLFGGPDVDHEFGGAGDDVLHALARDNQVDTLDCGPGDHDVAWLRAGENDVTVNCEKVVTVSTGSDG